MGCTDVSLSFPEWGFCYVGQASKTLSLLSGYGPFQRGLPQVHHRPISLRKEQKDLTETPILDHRQYLALEPWNKTKEDLKGRSSGKQGSGSERAKSMTMLSEFPHRANRLGNLFLNVEPSIQLSSHSKVFLSSLIETSTLVIKTALQLKRPFYNKNFLLGVL